MPRNMKMELLTFSLILYQSKSCGHRIHVLFMMYDVYCYCQMKKNEWLWTFWKRNDLYENFEKRGVVENRRGEEETKSMPHAPVLSCKHLTLLFTMNMHLQFNSTTIQIQILIGKKRGGGSHMHDEYWKKKFQNEIQVWGNGVTLPMRWNSK